MTVMPGLSRLFLDFCAGAAPAQAFFAPNALTRKLAAAPGSSRALAGTGQAPGRAESRATQARLQPWPRAREPSSPVSRWASSAGRCFIPFKAATAIARARQATAAGHPHVAIFWLATEDHDFAEIDHVTFPAGRTLEKLQYALSERPSAARPVGGIVMDERITPLIERALELLGPSDATDALVAAYKPGRTFAQAFADFYAKIFAAQGLLVLDASGREFHRLGAPVLRAGIERADELHAALVERNRPA